MGHTVTILKDFDTYHVGDKHQTKLTAGQVVERSKFHESSLPGLVRNGLVCGKSIAAAAPRPTVKPIRSATDRAAEDKAAGVETRKEVIPGSGIYDDGSAESSAIDSQVAKVEPLFDQPDAPSDGSEGSGDEGSGDEDVEADADADVDLADEIAEDVAGDDDEHTDEDSDGADEGLGDHELDEATRAEEASRLSQGGFIDLDTELGAKAIGADAPATTLDPAGADKTAAQETRPKRGRPPARKA